MAAPTIQLALPADFWGWFFLGTVLLGYLGWYLLKTFVPKAISAEYDKEINEHRIKLETLQTTALETLRNANTVQLEAQRTEMARESDRMRVTFTRMHEKRAEAIEQTYACIRAVSKAVGKYLVPSYPVKSAEKQQAVLDAIKAYEECKRLAVAS